MNARFKFSCAAKRHLLKNRRALGSRNYRLQPDEATRLFNEQRTKIFKNWDNSEARLIELEAILQYLPIEAEFVEIAELLRFPLLAGAHSDRLLELLRRRSAETSYPFNSRNVWDAVAWLSAHSPAARERLAQPPAWIAMAN